MFACVKGQDADGVGDAFVEFLAGCSVWDQF